MNQNLDSNQPEIHTTNPKGEKEAPSDLSSTNSKKVGDNPDSSVNLHIDDQPDNHFVLNLKKFNLNPDKEETKTEQIKKEASKAFNKTKKVVRQIPKPNFKNLSKLSKSKNTKKNRSKLFENFKFVFNTLIIFLITFVALNWSSYRQVFMTYYNQFTGQTSQTLNIFSDQELSSENNSVAPNKTVARANSPIVTQNLTIPKLSKEITPPGTRIIIPSIDTNVPVIDVPEDKLIERNWTALENEMQNALRSGVVHYPGTPLPGQSGNVVITGHSSYYPWDPGRFKDVFAVLHNLNQGDEIIIFHKQQKYTYQITETKKVFPYEVDVLNDFNDDRLTLITCTPIGTNLKRLIITAKPV